MNFPCVQARCTGTMDNVVVNDKTLSTSNTEAANSHSHASSHAAVGDASIALVTLSDSDSPDDTRQKRRMSEERGARRRRRQRRSERCINRECSCRERAQLRPASAVHLSYYRCVYGDACVPSSNRRGHAMICDACCRGVAVYTSTIDRLLADGQCVLDAAVRRQQDEVCLDEAAAAAAAASAASVHASDSDDSASVGRMSQVPSDESDVYAVDADQLASVMDDTLRSVDGRFCRQLDACGEWLRRRSAAVGESLAKTQRQLDVLERDVGFLYEDLYSRRPPTAALPSVDITDVSGEPLVVHRALLPPYRGRQQRQNTISGAAVVHAAPEGRAAAVQADTVSLCKPTPARDMHDDNDGVSEIMISDVVQVGTSEVPVPADLPPLGSLTVPVLAPGHAVYAMHSTNVMPWFPARIDTIVVKNSKVMYHVQFESVHVTTNRRQLLDGRQVALMSPASVRLPVGVRVVAAYRERSDQTGTFYSGIVGEMAKPMNKYRYMVFFDDGYTSYVSHSDIKLIHAPSGNVTDDVPAAHQLFISKYLAQFPERPMLKLRAGQTVKTECYGRWASARVIAVDASLVCMQLDPDSSPHQQREQQPPTPQPRHRRLWLYRGSWRLAPMFTEQHGQPSPRRLGTGTRRHILNSLHIGKKNRVYVEYRRDDETTPSESCSTQSRSSTQLNQPTSSLPAADKPPRAVARKSTSASTSSGAAGSTTVAPPRVVFGSGGGGGGGGRCSLSTLLSQESDGQIVEVSSKPKVCLPRLRSHKCGRACVRKSVGEGDDIVDRLKGVNPLLMPIMCGWSREIVRYRASKRTVMYRAPCGRRLRCVAEVHKYLLATQCHLHVDCFCFDFWVHCFTEFQVSRKFCSIKDLSYGKENVPVSCVNSIDRDYPDFVEYSTRRLPTGGVSLNLDPDFLVCCDCTDDCQDKSRCACWQETIQNSVFGPGGQLDPDTGYQHRRLLDGNIITGIYECNSRCKCRSTCLNRTVQHPLRLRLQVFKTVRRGWGIRCLDDIPRGGFICVYAGQLLNEATANEDGKNYGDEYLAELDFIEVLERLKEGYESDVVEDDDDADGMDDVSGKEPETSDGDEIVQCESSAAAAAVDDNRAGCRGAYEMNDGDFVPYKTAQRNATGRSSQAPRRSGRSRCGGKSEVIVSDVVVGRTDDVASAAGGASKRTVISSDDACERKKKKAASSDCVSGKRESAALLERLPDASYRSVRENFGADEFCYIMDAKNIGNIGRYLNHSCSPNVFVQNVFVDTHDLRFPWVAFFALTYIRAGTELTWDYNYEVGSVPGKVMYCHCGSQECRGRLL